MRRDSKMGHKDGNLLQEGENNVRKKVLAVFVQ